MKKTILFALVLSCIPSMFFASEAERSDATAPVRRFSVLEIEALKKIPMRHLTPAQYNLLTEYYLHKASEQKPVLTVQQQAAQDVRDSKKLDRQMRDRRKLEKGSH